MGKCLYCCLYTDYRTIYVPEQKFNNGISFRYWNDSISYFVFNDDNRPFYQIDPLSAPTPIYSESCEEWGNACIVVCIPIIELFIGALHISKGVVFLKALGSIAVLPIVPGYMGRIIMNPQYLDSNFSLSSSDVYSFETSISGSINENRMQLRE